MPTYFTIRNLLWLLALLSWPALMIARWLAPEYEPPYNADTWAIMLWMLALCYSPKAIINHRQMRRRIKSGSCLRCGHDLREALNEGQGQCPQCKDVIPQWRSFLHANRKQA